MSESAARLSADDIPANSCASEHASSSEDIALTGDGELSSLGEIALTGAGDTIAVRAGFGAGTGRRLMTGRDSVWRGISVERSCLSWARSPLGLPAAAMYRPLRRWLLRRAVDLCFRRACERRNDERCINSIAESSREFLLSVSDDDTLVGLLLVLLVLVDLDDLGILAI